MELQRAGGRPLPGAIEHEAPGDRPDDEAAVVPPGLQLLVDELGDAQLLGRAGRRGPRCRRGRASCPCCRLVRPPPTRLRIASRPSSIVPRSPSWTIRAAWPARSASRSAWRSSAGTGVIVTSARRASTGSHHGGRSGGGVERDTLLDEVPVGLEVLDDAAQALGPAELRPHAELDELGRRESGRDLPVGVVEQLVEEVLPALVERQLALQFVEHVEAGWQAGLDRELEQDPPSEGVQRADRGVVERVDRRPVLRRWPGTRRAAGGGDGAARPPPSR